MILLAKNVNKTVNKPEERVTQRWLIENGIKTILEKL